MIKRSRSKKYIYCSIGLAVVAVATVGFSSWILNGSVTEDNAEVNVLIEDTLDRTTVLEYKEADSDLNIKFDYDKDSNRVNDRNPYIIFDEGKTNGQDLTFKVVYTLTANADSDIALNSGNYQIALDFGDSKATFETLKVENDYLIDSTCLNNVPTFTLPNTSGDIVHTENKAVTHVKYSENNKIATITSTFTFAWGSYFNNDNPCYYKGDDYATRLDNFAKLVEGKEFNINLKITSSYTTSAA